jgi:hypothetical protein
MDWDKVFQSDFAVGFLGACISLRWVPGKTYKERLFHLLSGATCASIFTPALLEWLIVPQGSIRFALAFAVGVFGVSLVAAIHTVIQEVKWKEIVRSWLKRKG